MAARREQAGAAGGGRRETIWEREERERQEFLAQEQAREALLSKERERGEMIWSKVRVRGGNGEGGSVPR